jgi:methylenetetrahydrofolate reductase (NADPH)
MDAVRAAGLDKQVAILASVLPLTTVEQAKDLDRRRTYGPVAESVAARLSGASDPAKEGIAIAVEMAKQIKAMPGVRGIHILCGGCESAAATVIREAGLA